MKRRCTAKNRCADRKVRDEHRLVSVFSLSCLESSADELCDDDGL